jgi:hypothetical protein
MMVLFVDAWNKAMEEAHDFDTDTHARHQHEAQLCQEQEQEQSQTHTAASRNHRAPKGSFSSLSFPLATVVQSEKEVTRISSDDSTGPFPLWRPVRR